MANIQQREAQAAINRQCNAIRLVDMFRQRRTMLRNPEYQRELGRIRREIAWQRQRLAGYLDAALAMEVPG